VSPLLKVSQALLLLITYIPRRLHLAQSASRLQAHGRSNQLPPARRISHLRCKPYAVPARDTAVSSSAGVSHTSDWMGIGYTISPSCVGSANLLQRLTVQDSPCPHQQQHSSLAGVPLCIPFAAGTNHEVNCVHVNPCLQAHACMNARVNSNPQRTLGRIVCLYGPTRSNELFHKFRHLHSTANIPQVLTTIE
jgi:hypothetical protein